jgi:hypothetical protein
LALPVVVALRAQAGPMEEAASKDATTAPATFNLQRKCRPAARRYTGWWKRDT